MCFRRESLCKITLKRSKYEFCNSFISIQSELFDGLLKQKLMDHFSNEIFIAFLDVKVDIVTYKRNGSVILREFFERNDNRSEEQQKFEIVSTAAELIKSDIKQLLARK